MNYQPCDKCGKKVPFSGSVRAYSDAKKTFVRIYYLCVDNLTGYKLTFTSRRKIGEPLPKGVRA